MPLTGAATAVVGGYVLWKLTEPHLSWKPSGGWEEIDDVPEGGPEADSFVYIIAGPPGPRGSSSNRLVPVRVGQTSNLSGRFTKHASSRKVNGAAYGNAVVKWAEVDSQYQDGVERYLHETLEPSLGKRVPDVDPIKVSIPNGISIPE